MVATITIKTAHWAVFMPGYNTGNMKRLLIFIIFMFMAGAANAVPAVVDYIFDGDTFSAGVMLDDDIQITVRVRLINVDTPEMNGMCESEIDKAHAAKEFVSELLPVGTVVDLQNIKDDKYLGRIDANVILPDGRDVGRVMIDSGLARPYSGGKRAPWCDK